MVKFYVTKLLDKQFLPLVANNGGACLVSGVALLGSNIANNLGVGDFPAMLNWNLVVLDGEEGVSALDVLASFGTSADALA
jgi:hypothetical protein